MTSITTCYKVELKSIYFSSPKEITISSNNTFWDVLTLIEDVVPFIVHYISWNSTYKVSWAVHLQKFFLAIDGPENEVPTKILELAGFKTPSETMFAVDSRKFMQWKICDFCDFTKITQLVVLVAPSNEFTVTMPKSISDKELYTLSEKTKEN